MPRPVLSIIIVNFETPDYTIGCLRSIYENPPACLFEVILIDNGSRDTSLERIREEMPQVQCIETGLNGGFSKANNLGINNARGEYILLLNSDTRILDNSLDRLLEFMMADPSVGAVGPRQLDGQGHLQLSWGSFPTLVTEFLRKIFHHRLSINDLRVRDYLEEKYSGVSRVDWVSGSCLLTRRSVLKEAGLLDENFFMYFEDIDLCRRIQQAGWQVHYHADTTIVHYGGVSARKNILHVLVQYRHSQIYFTRKYYGLPGVLALKLMLLGKSVTNFVRWALVVAVEKGLGRTAHKSFANLLLAKKTFEMVFQTAGRSTTPGLN